MDVFPSAERFLTRYERRRDVDILLLDVEMGSMDGVALAKAVRKAGGTMPIVFVTGYSDFIAEGYDVEALNYLMKPVDVAKLFDVLDKAVVRNAPRFQVP
ncbi:LytR/AlgR family response regulator transcription factor [Bifidobacterium bifidum]|uniref:LytR/AlgR family response regulator transcription factor n=1 Tax=Bifidobacterium bifidum TaxID=1681 RepID=UPI0023BB0E15|nr:response regulator [Bifidobacterium bifidum]